MSENIKELTKQYNNFIYPKPCGDIEVEWLSKNMFKNEKRERVVADFIAGMTDRYAINLHKKIK